MICSLTDLEQVFSDWGPWATKFDGKWSLIVKKWVTICAYHVSLAMSHACMGWQNALMLHISVYHSGEVTTIFFSMHFTHLYGQKNVLNEKNRSDKRKSIFSIFFNFFHISPKFFVQTPNASYIQPRTFEWATGSKGATIGSFL